MSTNHFGNDLDSERSSIDIWIGQMKIIFAKTRHNYDSYTDFWRLVTLSQFDTCYFDEIDFQNKDHLYITTPMNGEQPPHIIQNSYNKQCRIIWWLLERPDGSSNPYSDCVTEGLKIMDGGWVSDKYVASLDPRMQFVVLGGHRGLRVLPSQECLFDYTHQSYAWGRRHSIYETLRYRGLREGPSCWGHSREAVLASSRLMLNLQQYDMPVIAPLRFALAAAYQIAIVTEQLHKDPFPLVPEDLIQAPYHDIVETVLASLKRTDLNELGMRVFNKYCIEHTFRRGVEDGVMEFLERQ